MRSLLLILSNLVRFWNRLRLLVRFRKRLDGDLLGLVEIGY